MVTIPPKCDNKGIGSSPLSGKIIVRYVNGTIAKYKKKSTYPEGEINSGISPAKRGVTF